MPPKSRARIFISHASEDKEKVARPLAKSLARRGFQVWFDEYNLKAGDSLKRKIDDGLADCDYGVVILSKHFFFKSWTRDELDGLVAREVASKCKLILPVWHGINHAVVAHFSPTLAGKLGISTTEGISVLTTKLISSIEADENQHSVREIVLHSPQGGKLFLRGMPNPMGCFDPLFTIEALDKIVGSASKEFAKAIKGDGNKSKPKKGRQGKEKRKV